MGDLLSLKGIVFSKFPSIKAFAKEMEWKRNKAARIISGIQEPNSKEIEKMALVLKIDSEKVFVDIFFPNIVHKIDQRK